MNNLFGIGASLGDLAKDFNGFVREVVEELQTASTTANETNENDEDPQFDDEERAIEEELRHQLLELSDDEDGPTSTIRSENTEEEQAIEKELQNEINQIAKEEDTQKTEKKEDDKNADSKDTEKETQTENKEETVSKEKYDELYTKYSQLKQNYRKSMLLVEKYQIHNKSLKDTLNEQMIMREQQFEEIKEYQTVNDELNKKIIDMKTEIETIHANQESRDDNDEKISIFEGGDDDSSQPSSPNAEQMVVKSVSLTEKATNDKESETISKEEIKKMQATLQKASTSMKELKKRYKRVKGDLCTKIEEFDQLKSQYVTYKISSSNQIQDLKTKLKDLIAKQASISDENGLSKELQLILNAKFCLNNGVCQMDMINPLHFEMIGLLNGCIETLSWLSTSSGIDKFSGKDSIDDAKSDSMVVVGDNNDNNDTNANTSDAQNSNNELSYTELEAIKKNVVSLREVVCELIAMIQQWLKLINDGIERRMDVMSNSGDGRKKSLTEEFTNID